MGDTPEEPIIHRWSTDDVEPAQRLDYYAAASSAALIPVTVSTAGRRLDASIERASLGPLEVLRLKGSPHDVMHGARDIRRSQGHHYYLMLNVASQWLAAQGHNVVLRAGEMILVDSRQPYRLHLPHYEIVTLDMPASWLNQWVRRPDLLVGRRLSSNAVAAKALAMMLPQLTPSFAVSTPLPASTIADQIGALLAATEAELSGRPVMPHIRGFGSAEAPDESRRVQVALRMLRSRLFSDISTSEIAERAGFASVTDMLQALKAYAKAR